MKTQLLENKHLEGLTANQLASMMNNSTVQMFKIKNKLDYALIDDSANEEEVKNLKDSLENEQKNYEKISEFHDKKSNEEAELAKNFSNENIITNGSNLNDKTKNATQIKALEDYLHSKGRIKDEAALEVTTKEADPIIPKEVIYNPQAEVKTVVDLSKLVTRVSVTTGSGSYPVLKRAEDYFATTEELKKNPQLAAPEFNNVDWKIVTRRGAIPVSEESIADSQVPLVPLISQNVKEKQINTTNRDIVASLKSFTAKSIDSATMVDGLKTILNVELDPGYYPAIVCSQSFFNELDLLKDKNGQYIFKQDISNKSEGNLLGIHVYCIPDIQLGNKGDRVAFVGDLAKGILFADRQQVSLYWQDSDIYGRHLGAALRYDVKVADANAGFFVTLTPGPVSSGTQQTNVVEEKADESKPDSSWTKQDIQAWLDKNGITYDSAATKDDLLGLVK